MSGKKLQIFSDEENPDLFRASKQELVDLAAGRGKIAKAAEGELERRAHNKLVKQSATA